MAEITFQSGVEEFDAKLNAIPEITALFEDLNTDHLNIRARMQKGQPIIPASSIEVAPFTNVDDQMAYAVKSYIDLDGGRILLSDFVVNQVWNSGGDKHVMSWVGEDGKAIVGTLGVFTTALAFFADTYRFAHFFRSLEK